MIIRIASVLPAKSIAAALLTAALCGELGAQRPIPLDTVRVSAGSRVIAGVAAVTRSVEILDRAAIDALPARSVADVIARSLGVELLARSPAQADLSIRGSSFEQILVLVDGVPVNDRQTGHFHMDVAVPLDAVERIEIVRGPAAAAYGSSAIGGVVNIVTRRGVSGSSARIRGGSFGSYALGAEAGGALGGISARLSADHDASDGHRPGTDHGITQARLSLDGPFARGELRADAGYAARKFGANGFYAPFDSWEETRSATAAAGWRSAPAVITVEPRVTFRQHDDDFILRREDPAFYRNMHTTRESGAELVARWQPDRPLTMAAGADAQRSTIESARLGDRVENRVAAFAEAALGDAEASLLTLGLRLDQHSTFGAHLSSSVAAARRVSPAIRLRASAASGFRAPTWTERYYEDPANIGSADLEPERFRTAEVGGEWNARMVDIDLAGFVRRAHDLIDWARAGSDPESTPWRTQNVEEAWFRGVEASARTNLGAVSVTGRGSLLSFEAEESAGSVSKYALQPLTRSASIEVAAPISAGARLAVRGSGSRRANGASWQVADARLSGTLRGIHLFADATNIFNASWLDVSARPAAGRAFAIGARTGMFR